MKKARKIFIIIMVVAFSCALLCTVAAGAVAVADNAPEVPNQGDTTTDCGTGEPTTDVPTEEPTTDVPTEEPTTDVPTEEPTTDVPTEEPTTDVPTEEPATDVPTEEPTTEEPTTDVPVTDPNEVGCAGHAVDGTGYVAKYADGSVAFKFYEGNSGCPWCEDK